MQRILRTQSITVVLTFSAIAVLAQGPSDRSEWDAYRNFARTHKGDVAAGKTLFEQNEKLSCTNCHRITGMEKSGPNLDGSGEKYTRAELIRQILDPSESIKPGYEQALIVTRQGRVLTGRLERSTTLGARSATMVRRSAICSRCL